MYLCRDVFLKLCTYVAMFSYLDRILFCCKVALSALYYMLKLIQNVSMYACLLYVYTYMYKRCGSLDDYLDAITWCNFLDDYLNAVTWCSFLDDYLDAVTWCNFLDETMTVCTPTAWKHDFLCSESIGDAEIVLEYDCLCANTGMYAQAQTQVAALDEQLNTSKAEISRLTEALSQEEKRWYLARAWISKQVRANFCVIVCAWTRSLLVICWCCININTVQMHIKMYVHIMKMYVHMRGKQVYTHVRRGERLTAPHCNTPDGSCNMALETTARAVQVLLLILTVFGHFWRVSDDFLQQKWCDVAPRKDALDVGGCQVRMMWECWCVCFMFAWTCTYVCMYVCMCITYNKYMSTRLCVCDMRICSFLAGLHGRVCMHVCA